jgi:hypothetical protein
MLLPGFRCDRQIVAFFFRLVAGLTAAVHGCCLFMAALSAWLMYLASFSLLPPGVGCLLLLLYLALVAAWLLLIPYLAFVATWLLLLPGCCRYLAAVAMGSGST